MVPAYSEGFQQIDDLCVQLLLLVEAARRPEFRGDGEILAYGRINDCASRIRMSAEERRQDLARTQWEQASGGDKGGLHVVEVQLASRL
jgi:hypothetical protein